MRYKDFPKHDFRRYLAVLATIEDLGSRATLHYIAQALECTRAEVSRAIAVAQQQFAARIDKTGPVYSLASWGMIDRIKARAALVTASPGADDAWQLVDAGRPTWSRDNEARLVEALSDAVATRRTPASDRQADVYRLSAQLLRTRYRTASAFLDSAARQFFFQSNTAPRPFPQVLEEGLVADLPRLRHLLEKRLDGVKSW